MLPSLEEFLLALQADNYSRKTTSSYERDLIVFDRFLTDGKIEFLAINKRTITQFKAYLTSIDRRTATTDTVAIRQLSSRSINRMLSTIRSYMSYLLDTDHPCPMSPTAIRLTKTTRRHPQVADFEQLVSLIESPSYLETNPAVALRNRAILEMLFSTGMRISELCGLNRSQIDRSGRIFITGKGKKQRFVYLTPRARQHLDAYTQTRKDAAAALYVPYGGRNVNSPKRRISANYIQERIKKYREKLQINVPTSAHSLRHGFATYLAEKGANPAAIQILLGHESLSTTTLYVNASDRYAEDSHRKFHPLSGENYDN